MQAFLFQPLRLGVPSTASELLTQRHRLQAVRGGMEQLVHCYNHVLQALSKEERKLYRDRIS